MVKIWIHKPGGSEPLLVTEMSFRDCAAEFDLEAAEFLQPLGEHPPTAAAPGPLGTNANSELVVFEVLPDEQTTLNKPGYRLRGHN